MRIISICTACTSSKLPLEFIVMIEVFVDHSIGAVNADLGRLVTFIIQSRWVDGFTNAFTKWVNSESCNGQDAFSGNGS
jgi:hypothetical protein